MKVYEYKNYDHYVEEQTKANKLKLKWVYVKKNTIREIFEIAKDRNVKRIMCHGTRNGAEQKMFKSFFPDAEVLGTEISNTAHMFPMTTQWDFAEPYDEWIGNQDIVYSNAFDHSYDPKKTIETWRDQLSNTGILFLEYSEQQSVCEPNDPLDATLDEVIRLCEDAGLKLTRRLNRTAAHGGVVLCLEKENAS